jgi:hypothetical protein
LEFIAARFGGLSLALEGNDSSTIFMGMVHNGSPSRHAILEESTDEGDTTSSGGGSSDFPISRGCSMVTPTIPIATTQPLKGTLMSLTISTIPLWTAIAQPDTGLFPKLLQAYQEEQQV